MKVQTERTVMERYRGAMLGLAAGDALGATLEFKEPGTFEPLADMAGGGPFGLKPGQWTDDTAMALCLAESLTERERFDPLDQLARYLLWYREGKFSSTGACFDIGQTVRQALERHERTGEPYCGSLSPRSAGNGSLMRLAPAVLRYAADPLEAVIRAGDSSLTTHGAAVAIDACRFLAALLTGALRGAAKEELLSPGYAPAAGCWEMRPLVPDIDAIARGSYLRKEPPQIRATGFAADTLEAALWAFARTDSFREGALLAVNLGEDADTVGAVYGQLAGAYYGTGGERGVPQAWVERLSHLYTIERLTERLYFAAGWSKLA